MKAFVYIFFLLESLICFALVSLVLKILQSEVHLNVARFQFTSFAILEVCFKCYSHRHTGLMLSGGGVGLGGGGGGQLKVCPNFYGGLY